MKLVGLAVNFLGDSITEGVATDGPGYRFSDLLARRFSLNARNYGVAGARIAKQTEDSPTLKPERNGQSFCARVAEMEKDADLIVVLGGVNDCSVGVPLGLPTDRTIYTFYGALHTLYTTLKSHYPAARVVVLTPIPWIGEDSPERTQGPLTRFVAAIRQTAAEYGLPVLDLYETSGLQPKDSEIREKYMPDGCHPNNAGHILLAQLIGDFLFGLSPAEDQPIQSN